MNVPRTTLERLTKPTIIISLLAAVWQQASVIGFSTVAAGALMAAWAAGRLRGALARQVVLFLTYLLPAVFVVARERFAEVYSVIWAAMLCGLMLSRAELKWSLPARWKFPLVFWGLIAACTWPVITLREADFYLSQLTLSAGWPATIAMGVMIGILWFDWLFANYGSADDAAFENEIVLPLAIGWLVTAGVSIYQLFGRMTFLNPGLWATVRRATGLLGDANVFGVLSAMWGPALVGATFARPRLWWLGAVGLPLSWLALWASGSRSALPVAVCGLAGVLIGLHRSIQAKRVVWVAAFAVPVAAALVLGVTRGTSVGSPISRILLEFGEPRLSSDWVRRIAIELWTRNGYGTAAIAMIRQFPFVGVGLSAFYYLAEVFTWGQIVPSLPFDNAQNWYRHQLAELGILGSMGWILWVVVFAVLLLTARPREDGQLRATVLRFVLVPFGLISLVGMPGQGLIVAFTFWTLAFYFVRVTSSDSQPNAGPSRHDRLAWTALWLLVLGHTAGTAYVGWTALRPPVRAQRADMNYSLGFYLPENDGREAFRWGRARAVAVLPALDEWMEVTVKVNHQNLEREPADVKVWVNGASILRTRLRTVDPVTRYVRVPARTRIMIETWVSRVHPPEPGVNDRRERGLLVRWNFVTAPPPDAVIAGD